MNGRRGEGAASILHADLDSFYASVEQRDHPALRGRPMIVGPGVVLAASYEAKAFGIRTAMGARQARALCPQVITARPHFDAYVQASKDVFAIFHDTTPLVEGISIDEAFLDVGGLYRVSGPPVEIARRLRRTVLERVGLPISVGVARTKFLAKVASRVAKPDGLVVVEPDRELEFLWPLPVEFLWGVGRVTGAKLRERGIRTVGEIAAVPPEALSAMLGRAGGRHLGALAHNLDPRPVLVGQRRHSIGAQRALGIARSPRPFTDVEAALIELVDRVTRRMRRAERVGRTVTLRLRFDDFTRVTRSHTLEQETDDTRAILNTGLGLLRAARPLIAERGLTLVGISVMDVRDHEATQLALPFRPDPTGLATGLLDTAADRVRDRFGSAALTRGALLGRAHGLSVPMLPD